MNLSDPELNAYFQQCLQGAKWHNDPDQKELQCLMACLDRFKVDEFDSPFFPKVEPTWQPQSSKFREIIDLLKEECRRNALLTWYKKTPEINSSAAAFRDALSHMIESDLKPQPIE